MTSFELTILGSNSALPAYGRFPTSQVLKINERLLLIDSGEGTQIRLAQYRIKKNKIEYIFISHLHGDHIYGLPGVITSFYHSHRTAPLTVYGPPGIKEFLETIFRLSEAHSSFALNIVELEIQGMTPLLENKDYHVYAFPVNHRITTLGYLFKESMRGRNVRKEKIREYRLTVDQIKALKSGEDISVEGKKLSCDELCHPLAPQRSYAYCADSRYDEDLIQYIQNVDLLYFETTYLHELKEKAEERGHCTARQAGILARKAGVRQLMTGHYSSRYKDLDKILLEARLEFENTVLGCDGLVFQVNA